jgi:hypothetical protein
MFTGDEDVEATALRAQGWSISAIARQWPWRRQFLTAAVHLRNLPIIS